MFAIDPMLILLLLLTSWLRAQGFVSPLSYLRGPMFLQSMNRAMDEPAADLGDSAINWRLRVQKTILRYFELCQNPQSHRPDAIQALFYNQSVEYADTAFYNMPMNDPKTICRHLQLSASTNFKHVVDDWAISYDTVPMTHPTLFRACVLHHSEDMQHQTKVPFSQAMTFFHLIQDSASLFHLTIAKVFTVKEPSQPKPGSFGLIILKGASTLLNTVYNPAEQQVIQNQPRPGTRLQDYSVVYRYFEAWNQRRMHEAIQCFTPNVTYYDLQYSHPIVGLLEMEQHLNTVADCLPRGFQFFIDDIVVDDQQKDSLAVKVGVQWHVENMGQSLPFTRGCSFYQLQSNFNPIINTEFKIHVGIDIPEPAVIKTGLVQSVYSQLLQEPIRILPLVTWGLYMYVVFFSNGILPGANALSLEVRTWEEVRDLSLNFLLVAPILHLPFSPTVHPMLEGIFNLLLSWAAMFVGFLSDERDNKPNRFPFGVMVVGMQFLTSAFLLPYLVTRTSEPIILPSSSRDYDMMGDKPMDHGNGNETTQLFINIAEWRPLGIILASIGSGAIFWSFFGRPEYGSFADRYHSLLQLLSMDRVGSSFIVDLVVFSLFQGWLIDDDLRRRGVVKKVDSSSIIRIAEIIGKWIPFYGLAYYFWHRPNLIKD